MSDVWVQAIGIPGSCAKPGINRRCGFIHPDFSGFTQLPTGPVVSNGIPFVVVNGGRDTAAPLSRMQYTMYPDESDPPGGVGMFHIPPNAPIEGASPGCDSRRCGGDRHLIVVDNATCTVAEFWRAERVKDTATNWTSANGAVFNLLSTAMRPAGWTSADAAGLSIYAGIVKYSEVMSGKVEHAIRVTVTNPQKAYVHGLATHYAGYTTDARRPPMGLRLRLKASYDCSQTSTFSFEASVICTAMKKYGIIIADGGGDWFISGEANDNWNVENISHLKSIPGDAFEAVDSGRLCYTGDCRPLQPIDPLPIHPAVSNLTQLRTAGNVYFRSRPVFRAHKPVSFVNRNERQFFRGNLTELQVRFNIETSSVDANPALSPRQLAVLSDSNANNSSSPVLTQAVALSSVGLQLSVTKDIYGRSRAGSPAVVGAALPVASDADYKVFGVSHRSVSLFSATASPCDGIQAPATIIVDSRNGSDRSCVASDEYPLKSLARALQVAAPGAVIVLRGGVYQGGVTVETPNIRITSAKDQTVEIHVTTLSDKRPAITIVSTAAGVELAGVTIVGGYESTVEILQAQDIVIRNCIVRGAGHAAVVMRNSVRVAVVNSTVLNTGQRTPRHGDGIRILHSSDVLIAANTIEGARSSAVHIREGSTRVLVAENLITNAGRGVSIGSDHPQSRMIEPIDYIPDDSLTCSWFVPSDPSCHMALTVDVINNVIRDTESSGIILAAVNNTRVSHNTLFRTAKGGGAAIELWGAQKWVTQGNEPIAKNDFVEISNNMVLQSLDITTPAVAIRRFMSWSNDVSYGAIGKAVEFGGNHFQMMQGPWYIRLSNGAVDNSFNASRLPFSPMWYQRNTAPYASSGVGTLAYKALYAFDNSPNVDKPAGVQSQQTFAIASWVQHYESRASGIADTIVVDDNLLPNEAAVSSFAASAVVGNTALTAPEPIGIRNLPTYAFFAQVARDWLGRSRPNNVVLGAVIPQNITVSVLDRRLPSEIAQVDSKVAQCAQTGPRQCKGDDACWVAGWHATQPSSFSLSSVWDTCLNGGAFFPQGSEWNRQILELPRHPYSDDWITTIGPAKSIWAAFGTLYEGRPNGFMVTYVSGSKLPKHRPSFLYASESDVGPYPLLPDMPVEDDNCESSGDRHILVIDRETCKLYETFKTSVKTPREANATFDKYAFIADSGAVWDLRSKRDGATGARPKPATLGWTSADAAGLPVAAGLVFWHEVHVIKEIRHALRFTVQRSSKAYLFPPATHYASNSDDLTLPPMGARLRLLPEYNCTAVMQSSAARVICKALQVYGMFLADNGGDGAITGEAHPLWNDNELLELKKLKVGDFEAVETGAVLCTTANCANALPDQSIPYVW